MEQHNSSVVKSIQTKAGRSKVWKYFGSLLVNDVKINDGLIHCLLCLDRSKSYHVKETISTGALMYHLRHVHDIELVDASEAVERIRHLFNPKHAPTTDAEKKSLLGRRTGLWMSRDLRSASLFACEGFLDWAVQNKVIKKKEDFPSPSCIAGSALNDIYIILKDQLKVVLKDAPGIIIVMLDAWTDAYAKVPYINVSIQFLDKHFKLRIYRLSTQRFEHPHTALNLAKMLLAILSEFAIQDRKFYLVGDGGSNVKASVKHLENCIAYIHCLAHCLHLLLTADWAKMNEFKDVSNVLKKIKRTHGKLVYRTTELRAAYENLQREDILTYLEEWENGLTAAIQADEDIDVSFADIQNARVEQEMLAEAGQESFSSFKSMNATRWTSQFALTSSFSKNEGLSDFLIF